MQRKSRRFASNDGFAYTLFCAFILVGAYQVYLTYRLDRLAAASGVRAFDNSEISSVNDQVKNLTHVVRFLVEKEKAHAASEEAASEAVEPEYLSGLSGASVATRVVVMVKVAKANLRKEPRQDSGVVMTVAEGSRLLVEAEMTGWFSVNTPTGEKAWVSKDVVSVG